MSEPFGESGPEGYRLCGVFFGLCSIGFRGSREPAPSPFCWIGLHIVRTAALHGSANSSMSAGPKELNERFVRNLPDSGPVVMVNLLRFKKESADGDGSGWDAYSRYSKAITSLLKEVGGSILWAGDIEGAAYGDLNAKHWDFVVLVRYPSRAAFLKMVTSPEYAQVNVHRENGVDDHVILASTETYSRFAPPKA
jgi:uncharacterized protein (DUF1330 family)